MNRDPDTGAPIGGDANAYLDADGCVPAAILNPNWLVHRPGDPVDGLNVDLRVRSHVATGNGQTQFRVVRDPSSTPAADSADSYIDSLPYLVVRFSNDPQGLFPVAWEALENGWVGPPPTIALTSSELSAVSNVAALASHVTTLDDMDIPREIYRMVVGAGCAEERRPDSPPTVCATEADCSGVIESLCDQGTGTCGCDSDDDCPDGRTCMQVVDDDYGAIRRCGVLAQGACYTPFGKQLVRDRDALFIGPASAAPESETCVAGDACTVAGQRCLNGDGSPCASGSTCVCRWIDDSRWKTVTAHELAHMIQWRRIGPVKKFGYTWNCDSTDGQCQGPTDPDTNSLYDLPNSSPLCGCAHVEGSNRLHCIQSLERVGDAEAEGFAQFFASRFFNTTNDPDDCTFNYYKEVLVESCPDEENLDCRPSGTGVKVLPPVPMSCSAQDRWRNNECAGLPPTNGTTLAELGTERDWMQFLWNWNRRGPDNSSLDEIFEAYRQVCDPNACIVDLVRNTACELPKCEADTSQGYPLGKIGFEWLRLVPTPPSPPAGVPPVPSPEEYAVALKYYEAAVEAYPNVRSFRDGVVTYYDALINAADDAGDIQLRDRLVLKRDHFINSARDYGVDESAVP